MGNLGIPKEINSFKFLLIFSLYYFSVEILNLIDQGF